MEKEKLYYKNTYHHLYNRGVNGQKIFCNDEDYYYFLRRTKKFKEKYLTQIICYCLMPNHFHFFVKQNEDFPTIGKFISDLTNAHTKFMNKQMNRVGVLYQGPTKSKFISLEEYFLWLCKYILNNPVRAKLVKTPEEWPFSSARHYFGIEENKLTDSDEILTMFKSKEEFCAFITGKKESFDYDYFRRWQD
jgi:REP element-mobilizing transposase RayT